jgi:predicted kinase
MPTLFLLCSLPGSGKTTLARQLEREHPALRLTPDEWMGPLFGTGHDEAKRAIVEALQWDVSEKVLALGVSVVLDWGFWSRAERDDFRSRAAALGANAEVRFLDVPRDELSRRLAERNAELPSGTFRVTDAEIDSYTTRFEPPTSDELEQSSN